MLYLCTVFTNTSGLSGGMVDTKDLKSFGHYGCAGSSPASSTEKEMNQSSSLFLYICRPIFKEKL